jgi:TRAP-type C4-dicarboxylate transport system permease small subunit
MATPDYRAGASRARVFWLELPTRFLEWLCIAMMFVLVLDVLWGVVSRFIAPLLDMPPSRWTDELATFLLIWVAMLGAAVAHRQGSHLGVNWLLERQDLRVARWIERFLHVLIILFTGIVMVYGGSLLVYDRFTSGQVLPALGCSKGWVYLAVPVAGVFIIGYSIRELIWPTPPPSSDPLAQPTAPGDQPKPSGGLD